MTFHSTPPASSVFSSFPPLLGFTARGTQETDIRSLLVDDTNGTVVTATTLTPASQSALCSGSQRVDCLFATELGEFRVWHLILIAVFVAVVARESRALHTCSYGFTNGEGAELYFRIRTCCMCPMETDVSLRMYVREGYVQTDNTILLQQTQVLQCSCCPACGESCLKLP